MDLPLPSYTGYLGSRGLGLVMMCSDLPWRLQRNSPSCKGIVGNFTRGNLPTRSTLKLGELLA
eukprot:2887724-Amphidinium_carterae.1